MIERVQKDDQLGVEDDNERDGHEKDEHKNGRVEANDRGRLLHPLESARRPRHIQRVVRPAEQRQRAPHQRTQRTPSAYANPCAHFDATRNHRSVHEEKLVQRDHHHQVHARAANEKHEKCRESAANLLERPALNIDFEF